LAVSAAMFKKKKVGTVQVYEDNEDISSKGDAMQARRGGADDFDDLGLSDARRDDLTEGDIEQMTASELEALALSQAQAGHESTGRALKMALETREIGVATATTMKAQTEQLERMGENIEEVHDYLDKSERIIDKMSKPKIVRMFQRKKPTGKGLDKVRAGKKENAEREQYKARGLGAVDLDGMGGGDGDGDGDGGGDDGGREELLSVTGVSKKGRLGRSKAVAPPQSARGVREDYSQYTPGVASVMRKQDEDLDQVSDALGDLKALADGMNSELEYQGRLIEEVQDFTDETSRRTKDHARRVNQIK
jgi:methyl-accepting chemotaxis protein